jgi:hypothetical protein
VFPVSTPPDVAVAAVRYGVSCGVMRQTLRNTWLPPGRR